MTNMCVMQENRCSFCDGVSTNQPGRLCDTCFESARPLFEQPELLDRIIANLSREARLIQGELDRE
jgi:hypothetical protein